jgi:transcriptional regulator with XRE-family HTH domain
VTPWSTTLHDLRRQLRLTQAELAAMLDVDKQSVSNWECGRNEPWPERRASILKLLQNGAPAFVSSLPSGESDPSVTPDSAVAPPCRRPSISQRILEP